MSKIEKRKTYQFFKHELDELLNAGFSIEQASFILKKMDNAINRWKGYHYEHIAATAGNSLDYLLKQLQEARDDAMSNNPADIINAMGSFPASAEASV
jgi:hypothetical protein